MCIDGWLFIGFGYIFASVCVENDGCTWICGTIINRDDRNKNKNKVGIWEENCERVFSSLYNTIYTHIYIHKYSS